MPRADIVAVSEQATLDEVVAVFQESTVSRLPVYSETLDQPLGLVHLKDLALKFGFGAPPESFDLGGLLRPLLYAPPSMPIWVLLQKMQAARIHMALVIDEYGGVDGLVTIEDLLEQIVGDIADEHDEDESQLWIREAPGSLIAQARMDLDAFEEAAGVTLVAAGGRRGGRHARRAGDPAGRPAAGAGRGGAAPGRARVRGAGRRRPPDQAAAAQAVARAGRSCRSCGIAGTGDRARAAGRRD